MELGGAFTTPSTESQRRTAVKAVRPPGKGSMHGWVMRPPGEVIDYSWGGATRTAAIAAKQAMPVGVKQAESRSERYHLSQAESRNERYDGRHRKPDAGKQTSKTADVVKVAKSHWDSILTREAVLETPSA